MARTKKTARRAAFRNFGNRPIPIRYGEPSPLPPSKPEPEQEQERPQKRRRIGNDSHVIQSSDIVEDKREGEEICLVDASIHGCLDRPITNIHESFSSTDANIVTVGKVQWTEDGSAIEVVLTTPLDSRRTSFAWFSIAKCSVINDLYKHLQWASQLSFKKSKIFDVATAECLLRLSEPGSLDCNLWIKLNWRCGRSAATYKSTLLEELFVAYFPDRPTESKLNRWQPQDFYEAVHVPDEMLQVSRAVQPDNLVTQLYPFQERAVNWLLLREGVQFNNDDELTAVRRHSAPISYVATTNGTGQTCQISHLLSQVNTSTDEIGDLLHGGILAEEMGLGKTVELIALILLHKRTITSTELVDLYTGNTVTPSRATLIITPPTILEQWRNELEVHAPELKVMHYRGVKGSSESDDELKELLLQQDVVLTTYGVLASEIHYAGAQPERNLRHEKRFAPRRTPLVEISWWRVCLDEAQMVESGVSNAAQVAKAIPRVNAWAVTGTPLRKDVGDLFGLLVFLHVDPFCRTEIWNRLISGYKDEFKQLFGMIAMRHTKAIVRDELHLPPQKRIIISVPFTTIEEQNYMHLFQQMCDDCGLNQEGGPLREDWDPSAPALIEKMRSWLTRLRQTCLHAEIGARNRRALGRGNGPLRTVEEVLEVLIEQNETSLRGEERASLMAKVTRAHLLSFGKDKQGALRLYLEGSQESSAIVAECREQLAKEQAKVDETKAAADRNQSGDKGNLPDVDDDLIDDKNGRLNVYKQRLRSALELNHIFTFFSATAYFQWKEAISPTVVEESKEAAENGNNDSKGHAHNEPDQEAPTLTLKKASETEAREVLELEKKESEAYESAKTIRKELLMDVFSKTTDLIEKVKLRRDKLMVKVPTVEIADHFGGIESRRIFDNVTDLSELLNEQAKQLREWRSKYIELLTVRLLDQDEDMETTGEEYELSTKQQDEQYAYHEAMRAAHADRHCIITGQVNFLVNEEMKTALKLATDGVVDEPENKGPAPEIMRAMLSARAMINNELLKLGKQHNLSPGVSLSLRGIIAEMRSLATALQWQDGMRSNRAAAELAIVEKEILRLQHIATEQTKALASLEKELDLFRATMNQRLEFYRQLQHISDMVAPFQEEESESVDVERVAAERKKELAHVEKLATFRTKRRFLDHLRTESSGIQEQRICVICQSTFEIGVLTVCGHQYCKECISLWWSSRGTCPTCKQHLKLRDFHQITYKPQALQAQEESAVISPNRSNSASSSSNSLHDSKTSIYTSVPETTLVAIKSIDLGPASYGTKIDTLARHLIYLRTADPGCKSIIFSQYRDFLSILSSAFAAFKIGHTSISEKSGIAHFRDDPSIECFLLHAKADSSGLNLVMATHVFLCEPLINPAIELQAIARVHRIGQRRKTTVWMYLVSDTVEEAIYEISVNRRLAHIQRTTAVENSRGKLPASTPKWKSKTTFSTTTTSRDGTPGAGPVDDRERTLDAANSLELQSAPLSKLLTQGQSGGEVVGKDDLWGCLFGNGVRRRAPATLNLDAGAVDVDNGEGPLANDVGRFLRAEAAELRAGSTGGSAT